MAPIGPRPDPPTGVAKVTYKGTYGGANWENVFWCSITGTLVYTTVATFATDMYGIFQTRLLPFMSTASTLKECLVTYYDGAGNPQGSASASHGGGATGTPQPASVAALISWKIPASWRGGKPRTYLSGISDSKLDDVQNFSDAAVAALRTDAEGFRTDVNAVTLSGVTGVELGTVSFESALAWRSPPEFFSYVAVDVQQRICTQRRRLGRERF